MKTNTAQTILNLLKKTFGLKAHDLGLKLGLSQVAIHKQLNRLLKDGKIQKIGHPPTTRYALPDQLSTKYSGISKHLDSIKQKYGLLLILLHGSQVSGQTHSQSDIDIAILPQPGQYVSLLDLTADLMQAFDYSEVDVSNLLYADPLLLHEVMQHARLLAGKPLVFSQLQLQAFHRYEDFKPYLRYEAVLVKKKLAAYAN